MKRLAVILLFALQLHMPGIRTYAQDGDQSWPDRLEIILRVKDRRTIHDGKLISLLSDPDASVRERAVQAFGSIQDTSVLHLLVNALTDLSVSVQHQAAFSIGQTGTVLSPKGRQSLEYDLIWKRLDQTSAGDRLIEEIGKFGTEEALSDLMVRIGNVSLTKNSQGLIMSIARFGIRGITSPDAVRYLLRFLRPTTSTPWQVVYALQRIGDHQETRNELETLVLLSRHEDPLVRMNLSLLLGKLKDERTSLEPLAQMAEFDNDWRVRVNALKALAGFNLKDKDYYLEIFRRAFYDNNMYIRLAALSSIAASGLSSNDRGKMGMEVLEKLREFALNRDDDSPWQIQAEAALALATLEGTRALDAVQPTRWPQRHLQSALLNATATTGAPEAADVLLKYAGSDDPLLVCASLEGLQSLCQKRPSDAKTINETYEATLRALETHDVAMQTTAASILGDSLFRRPTSVGPLLNTLSSLRIPDDIESMREIVTTLGILKDDRAVSPLTGQLSQPDRSVALAAASALESITGVDYHSRIPRSFEPLLTDFDFNFLRGLRDSSHVTGDTVRVKLETSRGEILLDLYKGIAPFTVMSFVKLAEQRGFFRGLSFHRVVPNFVIQGGDPRGDGWGGPGYSLRSEFSSLTYDAGILGMASAGKDTEGSQFFITQSPQPHLDGRYTIFGRVVSGMDVVNRILVDDRIVDVSLIR
jgi:peptidylprolyl isomerase